MTFVFKIILLLTYESKTIERFNLDRDCFISFLLPTPQNYLNYIKILYSIKKLKSIQKHCSFNIKKKVETKIDDGRIIIKISAASSCLRNN